MAASTQSTLEGIERRRAQLQESVEKLRQALMHWTTWEAEYQSLKEELEADEDASPDEIRDIARNLESTLLDAKEVEELLGKSLDTKRSANQVIQIISRRIDYVQQNSATIEKQLDNAEKQLAGVDVLLEPGVDNEDGLPMMDIEEELDDEGNEVSSSVNQTGKAAAEVLEVLRKAGLQKAELEKKKETKEEQDPPSKGPSATEPTIDTPATIDTTPRVEESPEAVQPPISNLISPSNITPPVQTQKPKPVDPQSALAKDGYNDALADMNFTRGTKVIELDQDDNEIASYPIIPQGESPEDAELRRQMLQYGLSEVGQIVAELDLDQPTVSYSDDEDNDFDTEDDEEEDQYGRTTKAVVTEDYRKQMLELEKKLNARMLENVGPGSENDPPIEHAEDIRTLKIQKDDQFDQLLGTKDAQEPEGPSKKKKGVRFADDLDISEAPLSVPAPPAVTPTVYKKPAPTISETIMERPVVAPIAPSAPSNTAKVSRFKSARAGSNQPPQMLPTPAIPQMPPVPSGPAGRTLANSVVEHKPLDSEPNAPDEFDPVLIHREIQADYHKARNKFIQQQGGFNPVEDSDEPPIVEEKDGKPKKVSRFMAARLKADGM